MQRYIGIDAHASSSTIAVLGQSGRRLREVRVETDQKVLKDTIRSIAGDRHICFEEGTLSDWMYEVLEPVATEVLVVQLGKSTGVKNDSYDAWRLAEIPWRGAPDCRLIFKAPERFTMLRKAVRTHQVIQRDMVRAKVRLHACYRARGLSGFGAAIYDSERRQEWLTQLPAASRRMAELLSLELEGLIRAHKLTEEWLYEEAEKLPLIRRLSTAPGIGTLRAAQIVATVISPHRFRSRRQFWSYCGLGIVTRSSSDWRMTASGWKRQQMPQTRGLNRNRNPVLKNVFKGAARNVLTMSGHPLNDSYHRMLQDGTKPNLALLTLARRIAAAVLAMWKNKEDYEPTKQLSMRT